MASILNAVATLFLVQGALGQNFTPPSGCCSTAAMLRFGCSRLVIERLDPLVQPGVLGSGHAHQIVGGNSFNASMTPVQDDPSSQSTCTSCTFSEDFSNYWTANLYFRARNGTFKRVPQMVNLGLEGNEGITVYYIPPYDGVTNVTAFKPVSPPLDGPVEAPDAFLQQRPTDFSQGFRMLVGSPSLRTAQGQQRQLCHRCFSNKEQDPFGGPPCTGNDTQSLPTTMCGGGIRTTITFPT